jgi:hypothetical protein
MIDVKTAVERAYNYLQSLQDKMGDLNDIRLEEVELSQDDRFWLITLGFDLPDNKPQSVMEKITYTLPKYERNYKIFKVNSESGEVEAMKIREL